MTTGATGTSHRERKKARTRAALIEVSQRLFAEQGYPETTIEQISAAVDIRPQTLFRYFDSKATLAIAPLADTLELLAAVLDQPPRPPDALAIWREYVRLEAQEMLSPSSPTTAAYVENLRAFRRWAEREPVLIAMTTDVNRRFAELLAAALAEGQRRPPDDLHCTLVATTLVTGRTNLYERWLARRITDAQLLDKQASLIDYVATSLRRTDARTLLRGLD